MKFNSVVFFSFFLVIEYKMKNKIRKLKSTHSAVDDLMCFLYLRVQFQCKIQNNGWVRIIHWLLLWVAICFVMKFIRQQWHNDSLISLFDTKTVVCVLFTSFRLLFAITLLALLLRSISIFRSQYANPSLCFHSLFSTLCGTVFFRRLVVVLLVEFMNVYFFIMGICFNIFLLHSSVIR